VSPAGKAARLGAVRERTFLDGFCSERDSSGEVQRIAEVFGAFHDLYLTGTSLQVACISSLLLAAVALSPHDRAAIKVRAMDYLSGERPGKNCSFPASSTRSLERALARRDITVPAGHSNMAAIS